MLILLSNNPEKVVDPVNYDWVYYIGFKPERQLQDNELYVKGINDFQLINNYRISENGICQSNRLATSKLGLEKEYLRGINQIVLNQKKSNIDWQTSTGEVIYFIGKGNHRELEI